MSFNAKKNMLHCQKACFICFTMTLPQYHQRQTFTHVIFSKDVFELWTNRMCITKECFIFYNDVAMRPAARSKHTRHIFKIFLWEIGKTCHALLKNMFYTMMTAARNKHSHHIFRIFAHVHRDQPSHLSHVNFFSGGHTIEWCVQTNHVNENRTHGHMCSWFWTSHPQT